VFLDGPKAQMVLPPKGLPAGGGSVFPHPSSPTSMNYSYGRGPITFTSCGRAANHIHELRSCGQSHSRVTVVGPITVTAHAVIRHPTTICTSAHSSPTGWPADSRKHWGRSDHRPTDLKADILNPKP